jgi:hypothetical protein
MLRNPFRHTERVACTDADATLTALVKPSSSATQRLAFRSGTRDAMLREFTRGTAPARDTRPDERGEIDEVPVSLAGEYMVAGLETVDDPAAVANALDAIVAEHRARTQ